MNLKTHCENMDKLFHIVLNLKLCELYEGMEQKELTRLIPRKVATENRTYIKKAE